MSLNLLKDKGQPVDKQEFTWRDIVQSPISKLNDDAFTRVRIILMNGIELEAIRFSHSCARMNKDLQRDLARIRRAEQHQATTINWLLPPDQSPLETTIAYEQVAIEVTAAIAQMEPDPYLAQVYRYGLLEDFDHLYRYSALMDRVEGKDANNIVQSYSDIAPGRPTSEHHRHPDDDLRNHYDKMSAKPLTKVNALTIMAAEQQTHNYYMNIGPLFTDPVARQLYAEIASVEEQHVTQYESIIDPNESWMEKWLLHEANEVWNYYNCVETESDSRIKALWERFLDYELGQLAAVREIFKWSENRDPAEVLPETLPDPISFKSQREFVRKTLKSETDLRASGPDFVDKSKEPERTLQYRETLNSKVSPSTEVSRSYLWYPGGEIARHAQPQELRH